MKRTLLLFLLLLLSFSLSAIGFGYHVLEIRTYPDLVNKIFPASAKYQFNLPMPNLLWGETVLGFRLDNGLDYRKLTQDPKSGKFFGLSYPDGDNDYDGEHFYNAFFCEANLLVEQKLLKNRKVGKHVLTLFLALSARFESSFELIDFMSDSSHTNGVFHKSYSERRYPDLPYFYGIPELGKGETESSSWTGFDFGIGLDFVKEKGHTSKNGVALRLDYRVIPSWMILSTGDQIGALKASLSGYWTPLYRTRGKYSLCSLLFGAELTLKNVHGDNIPYFLQGLPMSYYEKTSNSENSFLARTFVTFFGPEILAKDLYPALTLYVESGFGFGKAVNSSIEESPSIAKILLGFKAELFIYGFWSLYYECGYMLKDTLKGDEGYSMPVRFGFSVGI